VAEKQHILSCLPQPFYQEVITGDDKMKYISLTQGKFAKVDDEDFLWLNKYKWHASKYGQIYYAVRHPRGQNWKTLLMHRAIIEKHWGLFLVTKLCDHADGNGLNNVKTNLRLCDRSQNSANQQRQFGLKTSRFKGVFWHKHIQKWVAKIQSQERMKWLGTYDNEVSAAKAYNREAQKVFGEFARLNMV